MIVYLFMCACKLFHKICTRFCCTVSYLGWSELSSDSCDVFTHSILHCFIGSAGYKYAAFVTFSPQKSRQNHFVIFFFLCWMIHIWLNLGLNRMQYTTDATLVAWTTIDASIKITFCATRAGEYEYFFLHESVVEEVRKTETIRMYRMYQQTLAITPRKMVEMVLMYSSRF